MEMTATEIATQLTIAWINHSPRAISPTENPPGQIVAQAYDTILTGIYKAMENANQLQKK